MQQLHNSQQHQASITLMLVGTVVLVTINAQAVQAVDIQAEHSSNIPDCSVPTTMVADNHGCSLNYMTMPIHMASSLPVDH